MSDQYALSMADEVSRSHKLLSSMTIPAPHGDLPIARQALRVDEAASYEAARGCGSASRLRDARSILGERGGIDVLRYMAEIGYTSR